MNAQWGYLCLGLWEKGLEEGQEPPSFQKIGKTQGSFRTGSWRYQQLSLTLTPQTVQVGKSRSRPGKAKVTY